MENPILWIILGLLIILVIREITCWYWKVNERLEEQKKQTRILEEILYTMNSNASYFEEKDESKDGKYVL